MMIETKLWHLEGEQDLKETWHSVLGFDLTWPVFKLDRDHEYWIKTVKVENVLKQFDLMT